MTAAVENLTDDIDLLIASDEEIKHHTEMLKNAKKRRAEVESRITEEWGANGTTSVSRSGMTLYRHRDIQCSAPAAKQAALVEACECEGLDDFVSESVSTASMKSWIKEVAKQEDGSFDFNNVPESIRSIVGIFEQVSIRSRKS